MAVDETKYEICVSVVIGKSITPFLRCYTTLSWAFPICHDSYRHLYEKLFLRGP